MKAKTILYDEIADIRVSSLPTHPTAPKTHGGMGYSSRDMKAAFDKLPLYIIERYNALIEDISDIGEDSISASIPTGIRSRHTLADLFDDIKSGELATYFTVFGESMVSHLIGIKNDIDSLKIKVDSLEKLITGDASNENRSTEDKENNTQENADSENTIPCDEGVNESSEYEDTADAEEDNEATDGDDRVNNDDAKAIAEDVITEEVYEDA